MYLDNLLLSKLNRMGGSWNVKTDEPPKTVLYPYIWKDLRDKAIRHSENKGSTPSQIMSSIMREYKNYLWFAGFNADKREEELRFKKTRQPTLPGI